MRQSRGWELRGDGFAWLLAAWAAATHAHCPCSTPAGAGQPARGRVEDRPDPWPPLTDARARAEERTNYAGALEDRMGLIEWLLSQICRKKSPAPRLLPGWLRTTTTPKPPTSWVHTRASHKTHRTNTPFLRPPAGPRQHQPVHLVGVGVAGGADGQRGPRAQAVRRGGGGGRHARVRVAQVGHAGEGAGQLRAGQGPVDAGAGERVLVGGLAGWGVGTKGGVLRGGGEAGDGVGAGLRVRSRRRQFGRVHCRTSGRGRESGGDAAGSWAWGGWRRRAPK